ncbi:3685_t:CDS:2, partial [Funneliformis caledonium]
IKLFYFTREYLQNNPSYLLATLISYHYLLHISASIHNTAPAWTTWQYLIKRLCGMLLPQYKTEVNHRIFGKEPEKISNYSESCVFAIEGVEEELYSPSRKYCMNRTETQRLRTYYMTALNKRTNQLI